MKFLVYGSNGDPDTYFCEALARKIGKLVEEGPEVVEGGGSAEGGDEEAKSPVEVVVRGGSGEAVEVEFASFLEVEYAQKLKQLEREFGGQVLKHRQTQIVMLDGKYIGGIAELKALAKRDYSIDDEMGNTIVYNRQSREDFMACVLRSGRPHVFLEFADGSPVRPSTPPVFGKIVIELFTDLVPIACENFIKLCTGELGATELAKLHYVGCPVHRVVPGGWLQCGDIVDGSGMCSLAAIGKDGKVQDESYMCDFSAPLGGIVGYSTSSSHSIGSQFFITLGPCEWMNGEFVGIGRVVQGFNALKNIEDAPTRNQRPFPPIVVSNGGKEAM